MGLMHVHYIGAQLCAWLRATGTAKELGHQTAGRGGPSSVSSTAGRG